MRFELWAAVLVVSSFVCNEARAQSFLERLEERIRVRLQESEAAPNAPASPVPELPQAARPALGVVAEQRSGEIYPVVIVDVNPGSPAERAGLRTGDQIVSVGNQPIGSLDHLRSAMTDYRAGQMATMRVSRDSRLIEIPIVLAENGTTSGEGLLPPPRPSPAGNAPAGGFAFGVSAGDAASLPADAPVRRGAVIESLPEDSAAYASGLRAGDVIVAWNGRVITSASDLTAMVANRAPGAPVELTYYRGQQLLRTEVDPTTEATDRGVVPASGEATDEGRGMGALLGGLGRMLGTEGAEQPAPVEAPVPAPDAATDFEAADLQARVDQLERQLAEVIARLEQLEKQSENRDGF